MLSEYNSSGTTNNNYVAGILCGLSIATASTGCLYYISPPLPIYVTGQIAAIGLGIFSGITIKKTCDITDTCSSDQYIAVLIGDNVHLVTDQ